MRLQENLDINVWKADKKTTQSSLNSQIKCRIRNWQNAWYRNEQKRFFLGGVPFLNMILRFLNKVEVYVHADGAKLRGKAVAKG